MYAIFALQLINPDTGDECRGLTFASTGNEIVIEPTKTRMDHIEALSDSSELPHQHFVLKVPQVDPLEERQANVGMDLRRSHGSGESGQNTIKNFNQNIT